MASQDGSEGHQEVTPVTLERGTEVAPIFTVVTPFVVATDETVPGDRNIAGELGACGVGGGN